MIRNTVRINPIRKMECTLVRISTLVITKLVLLDSYTECFISVPNEDIFQIRIEEEVPLNRSLI